MTSQMKAFVRRSSLLVSGVVGVLAASVLLAGPAAADVPEFWSDPEPVPPLEALLLLGGIPLLLFLAIVGAVYIPAVVRGERITPGAPPIDDQWFGGPRSDHELEAGDGATRDESGGASGRW